MHQTYLLRIWYQRELHSIAQKIWSKVIVIFLGGICKKYDGECPVEKEFKTSLNWVKPYLSWQPKPISPPPRIKDKWMHLQLCAISWLEKVVIANDWLLKCNAHFRLDWFESKEIAKKWDDGPLPYKVDWWPQEQWALGRHLLLNQNTPALWLYPQHFIPFYCWLFSSSSNMYYKMLLHWNQF